MNEGRSKFADVVLFLADIYPHKIYRGLHFRIDSILCPSAFSVIQNEF